MKIDDFTYHINIICEALNITVPEVRWCDSKILHTPTQKAEYQPQADVLLITKQDNDLDVLLAITHELRHKWQFTYHKDMFDEYRNSKDLSIKEYNLQAAEVDANAYTVVALGYLIHIRPTFDFIGEEVADAIESRAKDIQDECIDNLYKVLF